MLLAKLVLTSIKCQQRFCSKQNTLDQYRNNLHKLAWEFSGINQTGSIREGW